MGKLTKRNKWCYTIGATGRDMAYALVSMFLMTYIQYTMGLTVAQYSVISGIIVLCMIWDAFNDPLMGMIIEKVHLKGGKYRPWILWGMLLNVAIIIILFTVRPKGWAFVIFFGIFYLLWGMTFTMNDISYWGMLPSLSSDPKERNTLVTLMSIFCCIGQFSVAGLLPNIVAGNAVAAYGTSAVVIASCFLVFQLLTYFGVKEAPRVINSGEEAMSLKKMFKIFGRNDQLIAVGFACLAYNIANNLLIAIGMNFFYFEYGYSEAGQLVFLFTVMFALGTLFSQAIYPFVMKVLTRMQALTVAVCVAIGGYILFFLYGHGIPRNVVILNIIGFVIFAAQSMINMLVIVMLNNTIEYDEYKFNERHESIISAVRSFATKLASAINQGVIALTLLISGVYSISSRVSELEMKVETGEMTQEQMLPEADAIINTATSTQLLILRLGIVLIPIIFHLACFIIIKTKYRIDEKKYDELVEELNKRHAKQ